MRSSSSGGMPLALVDDLQLDAVRLLPALDQHRGRRRGIFGGVVEEIEQHLLEQHRIELEHRQVLRRCRPRRGGAARILPARSSTEPTISPISCRAVLGLIAPDSEPGHVEQVGDEAVEPL